MKLTSKLTKLFSITTLGLAPLITAISCGEQGTKWTGTGSSSVVPIIKALEEEWPGELAYTSTGSGEGLHSQAEETPTHTFGMTSSTKAPENGVWKNQNIRTITWAVDAIGVSLNLPEGFELKAGETKPKVNIQELAKLYSGTKISWETLLENEKDDSKSTTIEKVYGRKGGKEKSGTADGFLHTLKKYVAKDFQDKESDKGKKFLSHELEGITGTDEPNAAAATQLKQTDSSLTYLSLGFALENEEEGKLKVADIFVPGESGKPDTTWEPSIKNVADNKYKWTRPFNVLYDTTNEDAVEFVKKLLSDTKVLSTIEAKNFVKISDAEKNAQSGTDFGDLKLSDKKFEADRIKDGKVNNVEFAEKEGHYFGLKK